MFNKQSGEPQNFEEKIPRFFVVRIRSQAPKAGGKATGSMFQYIIEYIEDIDPMEKITLPIRPR